MLKTKKVLYKLEKRLKQQLKRDRIFPATLFLSPKMVAAKSFSKLRFEECIKFDIKLGILCKRFNHKTFLLLGFYVNTSA